MDFLAGTAPWLATLRTRDAVIEVGIEILGRRFVPMCDCLQLRADRQAGIGKVLELSGRFVTGLEMACRVTAPGCAAAAMGAPGDPPRGFTNALDRAFGPTASGKHTSFLEICEGLFSRPRCRASCVTRPNESVGLEPERPHPAPRLNRSRFLNDLARGRSHSS